jgi:general secretion pathway protein D
MELEEVITDVIGEPTGTLGNVPYAKRTANTMLVVKDQQTVVIGGLVRNRVVHNATKIPLLGDIPVLGVLFRSTKDSLDKANLILVLTPHIIRDQDDLRTIFERKMQERQEFLDHYFVFTDNQDYQPPKDYTRTRGLLEEIRQAYVAVEERKRLDELTKPREMRTHDPGQPLEMPATGTRGAAGNAPAVQPPAGNPPPTPTNINVQPPARNIERTER